MTETIAVRRYELADGDGTIIPVQLEIGKPQVWSGDGVSWSCALAINHPKDGRLSELVGDDSVAALFAAMIVAQHWADVWKARHGSSITLVGCSTKDVWPDFRIHLNALPGTELS